MKIVVCGGAGYIGSVTSAQLLEAGHEVIVVDNLSQGHQDAIPSRARFIRADIAELGDALADEDAIDALLHFAALIAAGDSMKDPESYWQNNTVGSLQLLSALRRLSIPKLIFSSTAATYGDPAELPITEETATKPTNTYGMTKLATDMAITSYCSAYGIAATSLRYFNVAGAYKDFGERHPVETHIIPLAFEALTHNRPFSIFGDDYPTADGTCVRDYIHVADLARAHLLALDKLEPGKHTIYNLGNGNGFSNREVIAAVEAVTGQKLSVQIAPRRAGDPATLIASSAQAEKALGWRPEQPDLQAIVRDAWTFYQAQQA
jgi:UDP-glucose 4-epimerase